jgi:transposase
MSKAKLNSALLMPDGRFKSKKVSNTHAGFAELKRWLSQHGAASIRVCMEATGIYWEPMAEYPVVNPAQIKAFGSSRVVRAKID